MTLPFLASRWRIAGVLLPATRWSFPESLRMVVISAVVGSAAVIVRHAARGAGAVDWPRAICRTESSVDRLFVLVVSACLVGHEQDDEDCCEAHRREERAHREPLRREERRSVVVARAFE